MPKLFITHRPKTTQTIIEKLRRETGMSLVRVQDLAGIRLVGPMTLGDQDRVAQEIVQRFPADPKEARIIDRRANPSHGYRAVHVVVSLESVTIEIQVRTVMQHVWANLMERLADRLGRQIRYGQPPIPPPGMTHESARSIVNAMMAVSDDWASRGDSAADAAESVLADERAPTNAMDLLAEQVWETLSDALRQSGLAL